MSFQITKCNCNFTDDANVAKYNFVFLNCKLAAVAVVVLLPVYATGTIHCTSVPCSSNSTYLAYFDQSLDAFQGQGRFILILNGSHMQLMVQSDLIRLIYKNINTRYQSILRSSNQQKKRGWKPKSIKICYISLRRYVSDFNMSKQVLRGKCETLVELLVELRTFPLHAEYTSMHQTFS